MSILEWFAKVLISPPKDYCVSLGDEVQKSMLVCAVDWRALWRIETLRSKMVALIRRKWQPNSKNLKMAADEIFKREVFGGSADFGDRLFELLIEHSNQRWSYDSLTDDDEKKSDAIEALAILVRQRLCQFESIPPLTLSLYDRAPQIVFLVFPMIIKIPIVSLKWFVEIHSSFAFNEIRKSVHANASGIIDYLYEVLYLQQKIALSLLEFIDLSDRIQREKKDSIIIAEELKCVFITDLIVAYLKASIEKIMAVVAETHNISGFTSKKTHSAKLSALNTGIPAGTKTTPYFQFFWEFVKSENLEELNRFRSGILHKKGIADLQPHLYMKDDGTSIPHRKLFEILHEQHSKNSAVLLCALALLTDELVRLEGVEGKKGNR